MVLLLIALLAIDERYHTLEEVAYELDSLANQYPTITHLDTLGYSTCDSLPIFAMKISDNVHEKEDEPAILYVACHHAEEILGIEICMYMINDLLSKYSTDSSITHWINTKEIWVVPLLNPEGHNVVMSGIDTTWRKNKRDNNDNGIFDLDYDGVDPNRNYNFHWAEGGSAEPPSEYYRGTRPFSENETRAIKNLCASQNFTFCNTDHSARTGLGEVVYFPWQWAGGYSPDYPFLRQIADSIAKRIVNDQGNGHYDVLPGYGLDGKTRNWLYGVHGTFTFCIEVSTTTIQPSWMVDGICERNLVGAYYLLERADGSGVTGIISDSLTGEPLSAEVVIYDYYAPELPARTSEQRYGRFLRMLFKGVYNVEIHKRGYASKYFENIEIKEDQLTELNVTLCQTGGIYAIQNDNNQLIVYPNPANGVITIHLGNPAQFSSLNIYDTSGRILKDFGNPITNDLYWPGNDELNRRVANGIYYVVAETKENRFVKKVVIWD